VVGAEATPDLAQARRLRRESRAAELDARALRRLASQPLQPLRPQQPLDLGLFDFRPAGEPCRRGGGRVTPVPGWSDAFAPSLDDLAALAQAAYAELPAAFRAQAGEALFRVLDFADDETLAALGLEDPFELTGLYEGVDLTQRSVLDPAPQQPVVTLYRRPLLDEWCDRGDITLAELVAHVLVHEIGHHFGLSDDDIDRIERG
jgi:predicted Zn-dependent protease with MMP-like domain